MHGMIEVMRGCGRGCKFCDVTLRPLRYYPVEKVVKEIMINMKYGGLNNAWVHSDDIFVYGLNPRTTKNMQPNREALEELFWYNVYWNRTHKSHSWYARWGYSR